MNNYSREPSTIAAGAVRAAQAQVGQEEQPRGSNKGPMVNEYLHAVGLGPGYAWCQAFVYWCYETAAKELHEEQPMIRTAGVYDCWSRTGKAKNATAVRIEKTEMISNETVPIPGDQLILLYGRGKGHTAIIESATPTGNINDPWLLQTIEGNSNANGSREGYAVVRRTRRMSEAAVRGIIRYS